MRLLIALFCLSYWTLSYADDPFASGEMMAGTIQSNIDYTTNQRMIEDTKQHDRDVYLKQSPKQSSARVSDAMLNQVMNISMNTFNPEYQRRVVYSKPKADQWLNDGARTVGKAMGLLATEYQQRVQRQGRKQADAWYFSQARSISQNYIKSTR